MTVSVHDDGHVQRARGRFFQRTVFDAEQGRPPTAGPVARHEGGAGGQRRRRDDV
jgi:hypothetical protein